MYSLMRNLLLMSLLGSIITVCKGENLEVFNMCMKNMEVIKLGEAEAIITYKGKTSVEWCYWTIPDIVKKDNHAVILWLENISLPFPSASTGCQGKIKVPGVDHDCEQRNSHIKNGACWVYTNEGGAACKANFIEDETTKKNLTCNSPLYWKNVGNPAKIEYLRENGEGHDKRFTIHYKPISCLGTTTTPQATTSSPIMIKTSTPATISMTSVTTTNLEDTTASDSALTSKNNKLQTSSLSTTESATKILDNRSTSTMGNQKSESTTASGSLQENGSKVESLPLYGVVILSVLGGMVFMAGIMTMTIRCRGGSFRSNRSQPTTPARPNFVLEDDGTYENPQQEIRNESGYEVPMDSVQYEKIDRQYEEIRMNTVYDN